MRFYGNQTQAEIAARFGISQMHVSRLLSRALTWLRQAMLADAPPPWQNGAAEPEPRRTRSAVHTAATGWWWRWAAKSTATAPSSCAGP